MREFDNITLEHPAGQTKPNKRDVLFVGCLLVKKFSWKYSALLGAKRKWERGEEGGREKAPIIKAAFWFDRKLFSSHRHLGSRASPLHLSSVSHSPDSCTTPFAIVLETRNSLFESFGWRKCWQISERGASAAAGKRNQWWKENAELPRRFNQSPSRSLFPSSSLSFFLLWFSYLSPLTSFGATFS